MARQIVGTDVGSYTFNAAAKTITLTGLSTVNLQQLLLITNTTTNAIIYQFNTVGLGATISGNVITLVFNTTAMSNSDALQIIIDYQQQTLPVSMASTPLPTGGATSALQTTGNTSLATIATNTTGNTVAQGSTTSGQTGQLVQGAVTTAAPTYTTAQTSPLSLTTAGGLRVDISGSVSPLPTGAATSANQTNGTQQTKLTDGTNLGTIKAASTASIATDTSLVVALSPNSPIPTGSNTIGAISNTSFTVTQATGTNLHTVVDSSALPTGAATAANQTSVIGTVAAGTAATNSLLTGSVYNSTPPSLTTGQQVARQSDIYGSTKSVISGLNGSLVAIRPDNELRVAVDASSVFYDSFESSLDTTNRWTTAGTAPTSSGGTLTFNQSTTALATSILTSQPTFSLLGNMFVEALSLITADSGLKTGAYRFFGVGNAAGSPTVAAPITNGVGFEWIDTTGVLSGVVWSNGVRTLSVSLSTVQPTDGAIHRYQIYYKSSRVYFEIDNVGVGSINYPNPQITTLPFLQMVVNGASTVSPAAIFTSAFTSVGDTASNNKTISDGTFPWRKLSVTSTGGINVSSGGNTPLQFIRNDYTSTNVTTGAYVQLIASTSGISNIFEIFDSSGQTLKIAFGAAAAEVDKFLVFPGGNGRITCACPAGTRISIRAVSATASVGEFDLNLYT